MRSPSKRTSPRRGRSRPEIVRSMVVLPAPLAPTTDSVSPGLHHEVHTAQRRQVAVRDVHAGQLEETHEDSSPR
jgi:hypothetical protein